MKVAMAGRGGRGKWRFARGTDVVGEVAVAVVKVVVLVVRNGGGDGGAGLGGGVAQEEVGGAEEEAVVLMDRVLSDVAGGEEKEAAMILDGVPPEVVMVMVEAEVVKVTEAMAKRGRGEGWRFPRSWPAYRGGGQRRKRRWLWFAGCVKGRRKRRRKRRRLWAARLLKCDGSGGEGR